MPFDIGAAQRQRLLEQKYLVLAPEGVEVAGNDDRLAAALHQLVQVAQLEVPVPVLQGQVDQKNGQAVEFELDDQALDAGVEVVKALSRHARTGEKGVGLLAQYGKILVHGLFAVLALVGGVMPERLGDGLRLINATAAHGADVHLDQADDVWVLLLEETDDVLEVSGVPEQIARARHRHMGGRAGPYGVADVIDKETHVLDSVIPCQPSLLPDCPRFRCGTRRARWIYRNPAGGGRCRKAIRFGYLWRMPSPSTLTMSRFSNTWKAGPISTIDNCSNPNAKPASTDSEAVKEELRRQIQLAEIVILPVTLYATNPVLVTFQIDAAKGLKKPVLAIKAFGETVAIKKSVLDKADDIVDWNNRTIAEAIKRLARNDRSGQWEVIEFKLD